MDGLAHYPVKEERGTDAVDLGLSFSAVGAQNAAYLRSTTFGTDWMCQLGQFLFTGATQKTTHFSTANALAWEKHISY